MLSRGRLLLTRLLNSHCSQPVSSSCRLWRNDDGKLLSQRPSKPPRPKKGGNVQANKLSELLRQLKSDEIEKDGPVKADKRSGNEFNLTSE